MLDTRAIRASGRGRVRAGTAGFTLIELMVTLAVVGILAAVAVPAMTSLIAGNRLAGASGELASSLQLARSEAIRRNAQVTICASINGTTCTASTDWSTWIVTGRDNAAAAGAANDVILAHTAPGALRVSGPSAGIVFRPSGLIRAGAALSVCTPTASLAQNKRDINVMISGNMTTTKSEGGAQCSN